MTTIGNVLITGGAGFVGSHLVEALIEESSCKQIIVVDNMSMGSRKNLTSIHDDKLTIIDCDISDFDALANIFREHTVDTVCHLATSPLVLSIHEPARVVDNIIQMQRNLLECQRMGNFKKLITFSTSEVYGSSDGLSLNEASRLAPRTPYAAAKASADMLTESYAHTFPETVEYTVLRPFNNYGPRKQVLNGAGIIPKAVSAFANDTELELVENGQTARDFVFVKDTARAVVMILLNPEKSKNETFVVASGITRTMDTIAKDIAKIMEVTPKIKYIDSRPGDVSYLNGDSSKIKNLLGFSTQTSWEDGLKACIDYYSSRSEA